MADVRLDSKGIAELLKSDWAAAQVRPYADTISGNVLSSWPEADVVVDEYTTDRRAASVTIREVNAKARQNRDGILTRAAAQAGLEVREKS